MKDILQKLSDIAGSNPSILMETKTKTRDIEYSNTPKETVFDLEAAIPSGNDLHKSKKMTPHGYRNGDNPLAMEEVKIMESKLLKKWQKLFNESSNEISEAIDFKKMTPEQRARVQQKIKEAQAHLETLRKNFETIGKGLSDIRTSTDSFSQKWSKKDTKSDQ